jgi:1-acyl-sn-glycerol-3-phosphate acyltransferase
MNRRIGTKAGVSVTDMADIVQGLLRGIIQAGMYLAYRPKIEYENPDVMKTDRPIVFICNHMSHNDGALIASVLHKKKPYFLIAKDWYEKKQFGVFLRKYGSVPVDREGMDTAWYDSCRKLIETGHSILIFPEGKTSKGDMHEFQPGFAVLAEKTGALVVECAHVGEYKCFFGERKRIRISDSYELSCPKELRKSIYATQIAAEARERIADSKRLLLASMRNTSTR